MKQIEHVTRPRKIAARMIAAENDICRKSVAPTLGISPGLYPHNCRVVMTDGLLQSGHANEALAEVAAFEKFDSSNDPYGEHDMGQFWAGPVLCFFKFDYYADRSLTIGADPYTSATIYRVLTIMRAEDY